MGTPWLAMAHHIQKDPKDRYHVILPMSLLTKPTEVSMYEDVTFMAMSGKDGMIFMPQKRIFSDKIVSCLSNICNLHLSEADISLPHVNETLRAYGWSEQIRSVCPNSDKDAIILPNHPDNHHTPQTMARREHKAGENEHLYVFAWLLWQHMRP